MTLQEAITIASREGFRIHYVEQEEARGWWISTPRRPRRPCEEHGAFKSEERAWFAAASMAPHFPADRGRATAGQ